VLRFGNCASGFSLACYIRTKCRPDSRKKFATARYAGVHGVGVCAVLWTEGIWCILASRTQNGNPGLSRTAESGCDIGGSTRIKHSAKRSRVATSGLLAQRHRCPQSILRVDARSLTRRLDIFLRRYSVAAIGIAKSMLGVPETN